MPTSCVTSASRTSSSNWLSPSTDSAELDQLVEGAPLLSKDVLYGLAAGMSIDEVRTEITAPVEARPASATPRTSPPPLPVPR